MRENASRPWEAVSLTRTAGVSMEPLLFPGLLVSEIIGFVCFHKVASKVPVTCTQLLAIPVWATYTPCSIFTFEATLPWRVPQFVEAWGTSLRVGICPNLNFYLPPTQSRDHLLVCTQWVIVISLKRDCTVWKPKNSIPALRCWIQNNQKYEEKETRRRIQKIGSY